MHLCTHAAGLLTAETFLHGLDQHYLRNPAKPGSMMICDGKFGFHSLVSSTFGPERCCWRVCLQFAHVVLRHSNQDFVGSAKEEPF